MSRASVSVLPTADALADAVAERFVEAAAAAIRERGRFVVALSGGTTPRATYERLASPSISRLVDWARLHLVWGDERCVPPTDSESNYRMARVSLLDHVPVPSSQIHRMHGEEVPVFAAAQYEAELRELLSTPTGAPRAAPGAQLDFVLLGLGSDGHTASLFPAGEGVHEPLRWAVAAYGGAAPSWRITLTPPVLNAAAEIVFVVSGATKAAVLRSVLEPSHQGAELPARMIAPPDGRLHWYVDAAANSGDAE